MHPARSVIFFTTASGAGYGLLVWLAVVAIRDMLPAEPAFGATAFALAFALIVSGLLSSTFHLGHPERAWRALSQWRSSWLSREGVAAIVTFAPAGLFALGWVVFGETGGLWRISAVIAALSAMITVYCTAMIYGSLRPVPAWRTMWTAPVYLMLSVLTGALIANVLVHLWRYREAASALNAGVLVLLVVGLAVKLVYWRAIDGAAPTSTAETATGLGRFGIVRLIDAPHTETNYLMQEMGFAIARRHARKLRLIAIGAGFVFPFAVTVLAAYGVAPTLFVVLAAASGAVGIVIERWLFFAEARHTVTLYYGQTAI